MPTLQFKGKNSIGIITSRFLITLSKKLLILIIDPKRENDLLRNSEKKIGKNVL